MGRPKSVTTPTPRQHFALEEKDLCMLTELQQNMGCATLSEALRQTIRHWHDVDALVKAGGRVQALRPDGTYETQRYLALETT